MRDMAAVPSSPQVPNTKYTAPSQRTPARDAIPSLLLLVAQARAGATALLPRRLPSVLPSLSLFFFSLYPLTFSHQAKVAGTYRTRRPQSS
jgi:hypothetical protein